MDVTDHRRYHQSWLTKIQKKKSVKINNIKNTFNLPWCPEYISDEDIQSLEDDSMDNLDQEEYDSEDELSFHVQEFQWTQLLNYNREYEPDSDSDSDSELSFYEHSEYDSDDDI